MAAGLLAWARLLMVNAKDRRHMEAAMQEQHTIQEMETPDVRLLPAAACRNGSEDET
jgi:hypothetical protein